MQYRTLRGTGITVSRLSLGTMTFGAQADETTATRIIHSAIDAGINFIDTADAYVNGASEEIVGKALEGRRSGIVLASKVCNFAGGDKVKDAGLHRWHVIRGVEASLRRLKTDCLDICYLHRPDYSTPIEESLAAFETLVQQGKVVYVGMSNYAAWQICEALWRSDVKRWAAPVVTQVPYNLLARGIEQELVPFVNRGNIGITVYNPLAGGMLTGKHRRQPEPTAGTRFALSKEYYSRYWRDSHFDALDELARVAHNAGKSMTQLALQWLMAQAHVDSAILGVTRMEHLQENIQAADGRLDAATLGACDQVWAKLRGDYFRYNR